MKEKILEALTEEFVINLMKEFGTDYKRTGKDIRFLPVCHGGDNYTLVYYNDTKMFNCLTCCGFMDIFTLVQKVLGCDFNESIKFLAEKLNITYVGERRGIKKSVDYELKHFLDNILDCNDIVRPNIIPIQDTSLLNYFDPETFYQGWIDEGISIESMRKFGIRWYELDKYIIIPCRDIDGNIIGVRRRALNDTPKYMPLIKQEFDYSFSTGSVLYGAYENKDIISSTNKVIIFEGEKSVMKADTMFKGKCPAVATYGSHITINQISLLQQLNVQKAVLAYDYDDNGEEEKFKKIQERLNNYGINCDYLFPDYEWYLDIHDAPIDKGKEVFMKLYKNRLRGKK